MGFFEWLIRWLDGFFEWLIRWLEGPRADDPESRRDKSPSTTKREPETRKSRVDRYRDLLSDAGPDRSSQAEKPAPQEEKPAPRAGKTADQSGKPEQLIMGVDVGTSLSKVVVLVRHRRVAVTFDAPGGEDNPYLLPTALTVMPDGECRLGLHEGGKCYDDIKKPLIDGKLDDSVQLPLMAFMALLFQHVQKQIMESQGRLLSGRLDWLVNLGVPTESFGGGSKGERELVRAFGRSAEVAWGLAEQMGVSNNEGPLTLDRCRRAMQASDTGGPRNGLDRIGVFPEIVAQVASYVKSKQRQEGVHVLVDVGGGTLDVTAFQVLPSYVDTNGTPIWARTVQQLGTRDVVEFINKAKGIGAQLMLLPFKHLPSEEETARIVGISLAKLKDILESFSRRVVCAVRKTISKAGKTHGLAWHPGRMFLVGGGASVDLYREVAKKFENKNWQFHVRQVPLPRPDDLEAPEIDNAHWHRLAVAYGLSFEPFDIGGITPPDDNEPVPPRYWKPPDNRPSWTGNW